MLEAILQKLTTSEVAVLVAVIGLTGAVFGAIVGAASSVLTAYFTRRAEERRHYRQLGVEVARAKFDQCAALAQRTADATGSIIPMPPFDVFLLHSIRLMEVVSNPRLSAATVAKRIAELGEFTDTVTTTVKNSRR